MNHTLRSIISRYKGPDLTLKIAPLSCFYHQLLPATKLIRMKPSLCQKVEVVKIDG